MINATQLRVGMTIVYKDVPHIVMSVHHLTPGNKRGLVQTKLRNLKTGNSYEHRFRSDDRIERAILERCEMEYLYSEGPHHYFMNTETYEQTTLDDDIMGENRYYLVSNVKFTVEFYEGKPVGVEPPKVVELRVVETPPNIKGATAAASQKPATLETGLTLNVPPFIEKGEVIRVDAWERKYLERAG